VGFKFITCAILSTLPNHITR